MPVDQPDVPPSDPDGGLIGGVAELHGAIADWIDRDERVTWEWIANLVRGPGRLEEALHYVRSRLDVCGTSDPALAGKLCALRDALGKVRKALGLRALQQLVDEFPTPAPDVDTIDGRYEWANSLPSHHRAEGIARVTAERVEALESRLARRTLASAEAVAAELAEWGPSTASFATAAKIREHVEAQRANLDSPPPPVVKPASAPILEARGPDPRAERRPASEGKRHLREALILLATREPELPLSELERRVGCSRGYASRIPEIKRLRQLARDRGLSARPRGYRRDDGDVEAVGE